MKTHTPKYEKVYYQVMNLQAGPENDTFSEIIPDVIPDEKKPLDPIFFEDYEESDEEEGFLLAK